MIRRILSAAGLALVVVSASQAQTVFKFGPSSAGGASTNHFDDGTGSFTAGAPGTGNFGLNSSFSVWCVDQKHTINYSTEYLVDVSRLDSDLSNTRLRNGSNASLSQTDARTRYSKAAWLAATMTPASGNPQNGVNNNHQYAIWATIHGKAAADLCGTVSGSGWDHTPGLSGCVSGDVSSLMTDATNGVANGDVNLKEWYIITGKNGCGPERNELSGCNSQTDQWNSSGMQEQIAGCKAKASGMTAAGNEAPPADPCDDGFTPPNDEGSPTPEPATMSLVALGLAGMAGSSIRRRRK